jgi:hypothetical protein
MRSAATLVISLIIALGGLAVAPANAAVGCTWGSCDTKGPVSNQCDNDASKVAQVSQSTPFGPATAQLMYSPACKAYWTRGQSLSTTGGGSFQIRIAKRRISDDAQIYLNTVTIQPNQGTPSGMLWDWTNMAGRTDGTRIRACVNYNGTWDCTLWRSN